MDRDDLNWIIDFGKDTMKIILLRGDGRAPIKVQLNRWTLLMPMLFLGAISLVAMSVLTGIKSSTQIEVVKSDNKSSIGGISGISVEPNLKHVNETELLESIKLSERKLSKQDARLKAFQLMSNEAMPSKVVASIVFDLSKQLEAPLLHAQPVDSGYISSRYGMRNDPINGKYRKHNGIDIAAKKGSIIRAIGSGFVTFAGRKGGYGNVIEIHHSDSLKSRYAHLDKILVEEGDVVRQRSKIAKMGRTGRATGSHLHLEVWHNGIAVNPEKYVDLMGHRIVSK